MEHVGETRGRRRERTEAWRTPQTERVVAASQASEKTQMLGLWAGDGILLRRLHEESGRGHHSAFSWAQLNQRAACS